MRILLVEDEAALAAQVRASLADAGYAVDVAADGLDACHLGEQEPYDAVILDLGLPRLDGLSVLRRWRAAQVGVPVLILTARDSWTEKVEGIDAGADDYLAKPFRMEELLARIRALIRRAHGMPAPELQCGPVRMNPRAGTVTVDGATVVLTSHEFRVLDYLMHHPGAIVSKTALTEHIYAQDFDRDSNTIEVFVGRLRRKLGVDVIETVRGQGYRLRPPPGPGNASAPSTQA
ncbi:Virulence transcriptional regulatory protein PhoP [compost metagenome]